MPIGREYHHELEQSHRPKTLDLSSMTYLVYYYGVQYIASYKQVNSKQMLIANGLHALESWLIKYCLFNPMETWPQGQVFSVGLEFSGHFEQSLPSDLL